MADNPNYRTIIRIIEYHGSPEWLEKTLAASRIPIQGAKQFKDGSFIRGGVVVWQPDGVTEAQADEAANGQPTSDEMARAVEAAKTVVFKRPGEN